MNNVCRFIDCVTVFGAIVASIALILYMHSARVIIPVINRVWCEFVRNNCYLIRADLVNEGNKKAVNCSAVIQVGNQEIPLNFVPIDSLTRGRVGHDWEQNRGAHFTMYSRRIVPVRGYVEYPEGTRVTLILRRNNNEKDRVTFSLY